MRVTRHEDHHDLDEWTVQVLLTGDFETVHTLGDASQSVLPTDTAEELRLPGRARLQNETPEDYAEGVEPTPALAQIRRWNRSGSRRQIDAAESVLSSKASLLPRSLYARLRRALEYNGLAHAGRHVCHRRRARSPDRRELQARSGFLASATSKTRSQRFRRRPGGPPLRRGAEGRVALRRTRLCAEGIDFNKVRDPSRVKARSFRRSRSTFAFRAEAGLYAMARRCAGAHQHHRRRSTACWVLNKHNLLVDSWTHPDKTNPNHIFVPTDDPHGTIEATVRRI